MNRYVPGGPICASYTETSNKELVSGKTQNIIFWGTALFLFFWMLGDRGLWTAEGRWAEITREMFLSEDFFHPCINGKPYFDKPLVTYWLIALVSLVTGRLNEWTVRIPSAVSGILVLIATVSIGKRLWSEKVGKIAGWILMTTYGVLFWARTGEADMEQLAAIMLAVAWYWKWRENLNFKTFFVFYLICFIGAHTKGLASVAVSILAVIPDIFNKGRWRILFTPSHFLALLVCILIYLFPFVYADLTREGYQESGLFMVFKENIMRYFRPFDHKEPFYVYFYYLPVLFMPWTPLFITAFMTTAASYKKLDQRTRRLFITTALIFLFFTISGSRRSYYILPILPFCALLTSVIFFEKDWISLKGWTVCFQEGLFLAAALIEIFSPVVWHALEERFGFVAPMHLKLITPFLGFLIFALVILKRSAPDLLSDFGKADSKAIFMIVSATVLMGGFFCLQQRDFEKYRTEKIFAEELNVIATKLSPDRIAFYRTVSPNVLFYLNLSGYVTVLNNPASVSKFLESDQKVKVLVSRSKHIPQLLSVFQPRHSKLPFLTETIYPWEKPVSRKLVAWKIRKGGNEGHDDAETKKESVQIERVNYEK